MKPLEARIHHLFFLDRLQNGSKFEQEFNQSPNKRLLKPVAKRDGICHACNHNPTNLSSWLQPRKICNLKRLEKYDQLVYPYLQQFFKIHNLDIKNLTVGDFRSMSWLPLQAFLYLTNQDEVINFNNKLR